MESLVKKVRMIQFFMEVNFHIKFDFFCDNWVNFEIFPIILLELNEKNIIF
jgi:hypothetical protein